MQSLPESSRGFLKIELLCNPAIHFCILKEYKNTKTKNVCTPMLRRIDSLEKTLKLGKTEGRRRRGRQDEMVGWHHQLDGHEFEQALELVMDAEA